MGGFDRDFGTYAEQLVVPAADLAVVPDGLDLVAASTVPLNGLAAAQIVDLLGDAPTDGNRLLVTGAAGAVGGYVASLAQDRGWQVTGLARAQDEDVRPQPRRRLHHTRRAGLGRGRRRCGAAGAGPRPGPRRRGLRRRPAERRAGHGARDHRDAVVAHADGPRLADLLARTASGELPARVHAVVPLDQVADAHRAVAKGGVRGRYVLKP